jgi:sugar (pentulose or hexulose) kinase
MKLLSVDVGTTSCKAGLFDTAGVPLRFASRPAGPHLAEGYRITTRKNYARPFAVHS